MLTILNGSYIPMSVVNGVSVVKSYDDLDWESNLIGLGKQFDKEKLNIKILKCLDKSWQPKVTTISRLEI